MIGRALSSWFNLCERPAEIDHVRQYFPILHDWVVVVTGKEVGDDIREIESATFIKGDGLLAVAGANEHGVVFSTVMLAKELDHLPAQTFPVVAWIDGDVF